MPEFEKGRLGWVDLEGKKEGNKSGLTARWVVFNSGYTQKGELSVLILTKCNTHNEKSPLGAA